MKMLKKKDKAKPQNDTVGDNSITINADVKEIIPSVTTNMINVANGI